MDYSKIRLNNERNSHVTKRLNRLSTWKFFKVIYRENVWRMFGYNFLILMCVLPIFIVSIWGSFNLSTVQHTLPLYNGFGFSTGAWFGGTGEFATVNDYLSSQIREINLVTGAWMVLASLLVTLVFSGGFAVIRDAFWTGKLSVVGVFRSMWKGIKANLLYALVSTSIIATSIFGIYELFIYISQIVGILWLAIVVTVVLGIVDLFVMMYLMILCSVTVTYKQSIYENLDDAWRLLWLNVLPNLLHLITALLPIVLYVLLGNSVIGQLLLIFMLMFGGLYFPLVWQTHMMKTFALFHPVEVKKKKQVKAEQAKAEQAKADEEKAEEVQEGDALPPAETHRPRQKSAAKSAKVKRSAAESNDALETSDAQTAPQEDAAAENDSDE